MVLTNVVRSGTATARDRQNLALIYAIETSLTADGWTVLRFTWWQVMERPDWVREVIERVMARTGVGANAA